MSLECAHCGTRCDDGTTRCPKCLRTTHLVSVADAPAKSAPARARWIAAASVLALTLGGAAMYRQRHAPPEAPPVPSNVAPAAHDALALDGDALAPLVERARAERDEAARARLVADEVHRRRAAALVTEGDAVPAPRPLSQLWHVLPAAQERVTSLDLARLVAAVLRAAGSEVSVAARTAPARRDEPLDETGLLGAYVVTVGAHVVEVTEGTLTAATAVPHTPLDARRLAGAVSAQAALDAASQRNTRDRAVEYANAAVDAWPDGAAPLAARAAVWMRAGSAGGLPLAVRDLRAALAMRDDAALELRLARALLLAGSVAEAAYAVERATRLAPAWGSGALAAWSMRRVMQSLDAGVADPCALLRAARAPWTDNAYALCAPGVDATTRNAAARRMLEASRDPLRVAFAAAALGDEVSATLRAKVSADDVRETSMWLVLLDRGDLVPALQGRADGGAP